MGVNTKGVIKYNTLLSVQCSVFSVQCSVLSVQCSVFHELTRKVRVSLSVSFSSASWWPFASSSACGAQTLADTAQRGPHANLKARRYTDAVMGIMLKLRMAIPTSSGVVAGAGATVACTMPSVVLSGA